VTRAAEVGFPERSTLSEGDRVVVRAIAEAMFSEDGEVERARLDAHVEEVDRYVSHASKPVRLGLRIALFIVRVAPILLFYRLRAREQLGVAERVVVLSRLERSRLSDLSLMFVGWRTIMTLVFYEDAAELRAIGYGDERKQYKRALPLLRAVVAPVATPALVASTAPPMRAKVAPPAEESGVRLRGTGDADSERPGPVAEAHDHEHGEPLDHEHGEPLDHEHGEPHDHDHDAAAAEVA